MPSPTARCSCGRDDRATTPCRTRRRATRWPRRTTAQEEQFERDLKEAGKLRKQAAKLTNIGINSGSDLLTVKAKYLKERAAKIEAAARPAHRERSGEIRLSNSGTHAKVLVGARERDGGDAGRATPCSASTSCTSSRATGSCCWAGTAPASRSW